MFRLKQRRQTKRRQVFARALPVVGPARPVKGALGSPDLADAAGTIESIEAGVKFVHAGMADALVTNPIAKEVLQAPGSRIRGTPNSSANWPPRFYGHDVRPVMLLWSPWLAVVPATIHVPLANVPKLVTRALLIETAKIVDADFQAPFWRRRAAARFRRA